VREERRAVAGLAPAAMRKLEAYDWPNNVRQLENRIRRAVLHAEGTIIQAAEIELPVRAADGPKESLADRKAEVVRVWLRAQIQEALVLCNGNVTQAAGLLLTSPRQLRRIMHDLGI